MPGFEKAYTNFEKAKGDKSGQVPDKIKKEYIEKEEIFLQSLRTDYEKNRIDNLHAGLG
jgi:hypothetical protein